MRRRLSYRDIFEPSGGQGNIWQSRMDASGFEHAEAGNEDGGPSTTRPIGLTDAEMFPELSSAFDALYFCVTPANQFRKYYREGTYDDCDKSYNMFWRELRMLSCKHEST